MSEQPIQEMKQSEFIGNRLRVDVERSQRVCHACGNIRSPLDQPREGYSESLHIVVREHKTVNAHPRPGIDIESSPQIIADVRFWRNGGPEDYLCNDCIRLAARILIKRLEEIAS